MSSRSILPVITQRNKLTHLCKRAVDEGNYELDSMQQWAFLAFVDSIPADEIRVEDATLEQAWDLLTAFFEPDCQHILPQRFLRHLVLWKEGNCWF